MGKQTNFQTSKKTLHCVKCEEDIDMPIPGEKQRLEQIQLFRFMSCLLGILGQETVLFDASQITRIPSMYLALPIYLVSLPHLLS